MMHAATHRATKPLKHTLIIHPKNLNGRQITHQISVNGKNNTLNISALLSAFYQLITAMLLIIIFSIFIIYEIIPVPVIEVFSIYKVIQIIFGCFSFLFALSL